MPSLCSVIGCVRASTCLFESGLERHELVCIQHVCDMKYGSPPCRLAKLASTSLAEILGSKIAKDGSAPVLRAQDGEKPDEVMRKSHEARDWGGAGKWNAGSGDENPQSVPSHLFFLWLSTPPSSPLFLSLSFSLSHACDPFPSNALT